MGPPWRYCTIVCCFDTIPCPSTGARKLTMLDWGTGLFELVVHTADLALVTGTVKIVYIDDIILVGHGVSTDWSSAWPEWCHQYTIRDYMLFYLQVLVAGLNNQLKRVCIILSFQVAYCAPWVINTFSVAVLNICCCSKPFQLCQS